jgi:hypothetical protein
MARHVVWYRGCSWRLAQLARQHDIDRRTLQCRLDRGIEIELALTLPVRVYPEGVRRPRDTQHKAASIVLCDRCGNGQHVRPMRAMDEISLCLHCRALATKLLLSFVARQ